MTKTNALETEIFRALTQRWPGYVLLHVKTNPTEVAKLFAAQMGDTFSTSDIDAYVEALKKLYPHNVSEVAHILLETREKLQEKAVDADVEKFKTAVEVLGEAYEESKAQLESTPVEEHTGPLAGLGPIEEVSLDKPINPFRELPADVLLGAKDVAEKLGRGYTYVKTHAEELGGYKNGRGQWVFTAGTLAGIFEAQLFKG